MSDLLINKILAAGQSSEPPVIDDKKKSITEGSDLLFRSILTKPYLVDYSPRSIGLIPTPQGIVKLGESKYDWGLLPSHLYNLQDIRADRQGPAREAIYSTANFLSELTLGTLKGISDVPDVFRAFFNDEGLSALGDEDFPNLVSQMLGSAIEGMEAPVYRHTSGFHPGEWIGTYGPSAVASGVTMLIPGIGAGKAVGSIARVAGYLGRAARVGKILSKAPYLASKVGKLGGIGKNTVAAFETFGSSMFMNAQESITQLMPELQELKKRYQEAGLSEEQIDIKLKGLAWRNYLSNLPNAALDMIGWWHILKPSSFIMDAAKVSPMGTRILPGYIGKKIAGQEIKAFKPRFILGTIVKEPLPESGQEWNNAFQEKRDRRDVDIDLGKETVPYTFAEGMTDPDIWNAFVWGGIGSMAFIGMGGAFRQMQENIGETSQYNQLKKQFSEEQFTEFKKLTGYDLQKRSWVSDIPKAMFTGMTRRERAGMSKQQNALLDINKRFIALTEQKNIVDLSGNVKLYNEINEMLMTEFALGSMTRGSYPQLIETLEKMDTYVGGVIASKEFQTADESLQKQYRDLKDNLQKVKETFPKVLKYYTKASNLYNITDPLMLSEYVRLSQDIEQIDNDINDVKTKAFGYYAEDEFGILRKSSNPKVKDYLDKKQKLDEKITDIQTQLQDPLVTGEFEAKLNNRLNKLLGDLKALDDTMVGIDKTEQLSVGEDEALTLARLSIKRQEKNQRIRDIISGRAAKEDAKITKEFKEDYDYAAFIYGDKVDEGIYNLVKRKKNDARINSDIQTSGNEKVRMALLPDSPISLSEVFRFVKDNNIVLNEANKANLRSKIDQENIKLRSERSGVIKGYLINNEVRDDMGDLIEDISPEEIEKMIETGDLKERLNSKYPLVGEDLFNIIQNYQSIINYNDTSYNSVIEYDGKDNQLTTDDQVIDYYLNKMIDSMTNLINDIRDKKLYSISSLNEIGKAIVKSGVILKFIEDKRHKDKYDSKILNVIKDKANNLKSLSENVAREVQKELDNSDLQQQIKYDQWISKLGELLNTIYPGFKSTDIIEIFNKIAELKKDQSKVNQLLSHRTALGTELYNIIGGELSAQREKVGIYPLICTNQPEFAFYAYSLTMYRESDDAEVRKAQKQFEYTLDPDYLISYSTEEQKKAIELVKELSVINKLFMINNSSISINDIVSYFELINKRDKDNNKRPMPEQIIAIQEILFGLNNDDVRNMFLLGSAGTGKTTMVLKAVAEFTKRNKTNAKLAAMSIGKDQNNKINEEALGITGQYKEWFDDRGVIASERDNLIKILTETDILIFDEAGKFNQFQWLDFSRIVNKVREVNKGLKIVFAGDPQQSKSGSFVEVIDSRKSLLNELLTANMTVITPLTFSQRSANGSVNRLMQEIITLNDNNIIDAKLNYTYTGDERSGVKFSDRDGFNAGIQQKIARNESVVIITDDYKIAGPTGYAILYPSVKVLTVDNAMGMEYDNVFIDLDYKGNVKQKFADSNVSLYTAVSRATNYVNLLFNKLINNSVEDNSLSNSMADNAKQARFDKNKEQFEKYTNSLKDKIKPTEPVKPKTTEEYIEQQAKTFVKDESVKDENESNNLDNVINENDYIQNIDVDNGEDIGIDIHNSLDPNYQEYLTEQVKQDGTIFPRYEGVKKAKKDDEILIYARNDETGGSQYVYLLRDGDTFTEVAIKQSDKQYKERLPYNRTFTLSQLDQLSGAFIGRTKVKFATPLTYIWSDKKTNLLQGLDTVLNKIKSVFSRKNQGVEDITSEVILPIKKEDVDKYKELNPEMNFVQGVPYLHITIKVKEGKKDIHQFILLEGKQLNINDIKYGTQSKDNPKGLPSNLRILYDFNTKRKYLDLLFKNLGFEQIQYGKNNNIVENTEYGKGTSRKYYDTTQHELFMNALSYQVDADGSYVGTSGYTVVRELWTKINQLDEKQKKEIVDVINEVKNGLYSIDKTKIIDLREVSDPVNINKHAVLSETRVKVLTAKQFDAMGVEVDPVILDKIDKGFVIVQTTDLKGTWALRQTFEITGKTAEDAVQIIHVLIDYNLIKDDKTERYVLEDKKPITELFTVSVNDYDTMVKSGNNRKMRVRDEEGNNVLWKSGARTITEFRAYDALRNHDKLVEDIRLLIEEGLPKKKNGSTQSAFNQIAKSNLKIYLDPRQENGLPGRMIGLRQVVKDNKKDGTNDKVERDKIVGISLTRPLDTFIYHPDVTNIKTDAEGKQTILPAKKVIDNRIITDKDGNEKTVPVYDMFDLDMLLNEMTKVDTGGNSIVNNGFGLRETLDRGTWKVAYNPETEQEIQLSKTYDYKGKVLSMLQTGFYDLQETIITFDDTENKPITGEEAVPVLPADLQSINLIQDPDQKKIALLEYKSKLGKRDPENRIVDEMLRSIPDNNESVKQDIEVKTNEEQSKEGKDIHNQCK